MEYIKRMKNIYPGLMLLILITSCNSGKYPVLETGSMSPMPDRWTDRDTGHKISRLTNRQGENRSFYFHNNPFLPASEGQNSKMVFYGDTENGMQLFSVDLGNGQTEQITAKKGVTGEIVGPTRRKVYYQCGDSVFSTGVENRETRLIFIFPDTVRGRISTLNADETLLAGSISTSAEADIFRQFPEKRGFFNRVYEAKLRRSLFTLTVETGELKIIHSENAWLNHIQFSPTDPRLLMFCHEGPWHLVDRIWTIRIDGGVPVLMHRRTVEREIAGHEFFSRDGKRIWFDLQIPRGETFWLASVDILSGETIRYAMERNEWSIHFNISPDQKLFAGDGGDPGQVARAEDGMWIYLFRPEEDRLVSEKLVNMKHHQYQLEPNVHFSPDGKMIIFRANFEGHSDIYAVEINK